jgi:hypothetical protein
VDYLVGQIPENDKPECVAVAASMETAMLISLLPTEVDHM